MLFCACFCAFVCVVLVFLLFFVLFLCLACAGFGGWYLRVNEVLRFRNGLGV